MTIKKLSDQWWAEGKHFALSVKT